MQEIIHLHVFCVFILFFVHLIVSLQRQTYIIINNGFNYDTKKFVFLPHNSILYGMRWQR